MISSNSLTMALILLVLFQYKHFVVDFVIQTPWMYLNKGRLGHPGGLTHAGLHAVTTWCLLFSFDVKHAVLLALLDFVVHYLIDWVKTNACQTFKYTPSTYGFWLLLGADQTLHQLTYLTICAIALS